jgi:hypothetical protein
MKNLMKLLIVIVMFGIATDSLAQSFGIKAGLNLSNMLIKDDDEIYTDNSRMKPGFNAGATLEFPIKGMFSFDMGLLLSTKGYKLDEKLGNYETASTIKLLYIDIPLTGKAYFNIGGAKIYGAFGPYLGIGLSGEGKYEVTINGNTTNETVTVDWGTDPVKDDMKRLDFGLTAGAGVEFNSIEIGMSYGLGFANISSYTDGGRKVSNRVLGISLGYKFGIRYH